MKRRHGENAQRRRAALMQAAVEVTAEKGMAGVTHRAVTERAGLPLATVGYFFDSIDELAVEALRTRIAADAETMGGLAEHLKQQDSGPDEVAAAFAAAAGSLPRVEAMALVEAMLHAARAPELRHVVVEALDMGRGVVAAAAATAGLSDEEADTGAFLALIHGYMLHSLAAPDLVDSEALLRGVRALFLGGLLEAGHVDLALELAGRDPDS
ncbi:TetR/AcrR family transcriptional regulator [Streptomyces sp. NPDC057675]|uniref:TetR/AcrR family transcriptional regulator n=1 Tax=Streptomyces sp. NPDC057675 TaxID=3346204 RepID=UPI0036893EEE